MQARTHLGSDDRKLPSHLGKKGHSTTSRGLRRCRPSPLDPLGSFSTALSITTSTPAFHSIRPRYAGNLGIRIGCPHRSRTNSIAFHSPKPLLPRLAKPCPPKGMAPHPKNRLKRVPTCLDG